MLLCDMANAQKVPSRPTISFHFHLIPECVLGENSVTGVSFRIGKAEQDVSERANIPCELFLRSIGFRSAPIRGVPFDDVNGVVPNKKGRVSGTRQLIQAYMSRAG